MDHFETEAVRSPRKILWSLCSPRVMKEEKASGKQGRSPITENGWIADALHGGTFSGAC